MGPAAGLAARWGRALVGHGRRKVLLVAGFALLFVCADVAAQFTTTGSGALGGVSWARVPLSVVGGVAVPWAFLSLLDALGSPGPGIEDEGPDTGKTWRPDFRLPVAAFVVTAVAWGVVFAHYWPMASINDTEWILRDPMGASTQHPLAYNYGLYGLVHLGEALGGGELGGVVLAALVQTLAWSAVTAYLVHTLATLGCSRTAVWILVAYCALSPLVADYAFSLVKDAPFSAFVVLLAPVLLRIHASGGGALRRIPFLVLTVTALVGVAVTRNNGVPVMVVLLVLVVWLAPRHRRRAVVVGAVSLALAAVPLGVSRVVAGPQKLVESLGVPLQMVGHAVAHNPACLSAADSRYFASVMDLRAWASTYSPKSVDPVKFSSSFHGWVIVDDPSSFATHWLSAALSCPAQFFRGYVSQTGNLWRIDAAPVSTTGQSVFTSAVTNSPSNREALIERYSERGIVNHTLWPAPLDAAISAVQRVGLALTPGAGTWLWAMLLLIAGFLHRRSSTWVPLFAPSLLVWATLMIAAPTTHPFRYVQFIVLTVPVGLVVLLGCPGPAGPSALVEEDRPTP